MTNGKEIRAQIDTETVKALLIVNGGGVVALLSMFASIIGKNGFESLAKAILIGVLFLMLGLASAVIHNHLRRRCSLVYEQTSVKNGYLFGFVLPSPTVCFLSWLFMWCSIIAFVCAGTLVALTGICTIT
jgi:hypothetical protein